jgi:hypothetical protein
MGQVLVGIIIVAVLDFKCLWDVDWDIFKNNSAEQYGELGFLLNSFTKLERKYFVHLNRELRKNRVHP